MAYKVFIDPGHGHEDSGACANNLKEKDANLVSSLETKKVLESHGVQVKLSRTDDRTNPSISQRTDMANKWGANYFVSVHNNSGVNGKRGGVEAIHSLSGGDGEKLAKCLVESICTTGQTPRPKPTFSRKGSNGKDYYGVIRQTNMKAVIIECAFVDGTDHVFINTTAKQVLMGTKIAKGILEFLGIAYKGGDSAPQPVLSNDHYKVCVSSFKEEKYADELVKELLGKSLVGSHHIWNEDIKYHRTYAGDCMSKADATNLLAKVKSLGYKDAFVVAK